MAYIRNVVLGVAHAHPARLNPEERAIVEAITPRQRTKFQRSGIVPPAVLALFKRWAVLPEHFLADGWGCKLDHLISLLRKELDARPSAVLAWLFRDTVESEWRARSGPRREGRRA